MTKECDEWEKNRTVNPKTGRKISATGSIYKKLEKECRKQRPKEDLCAEWLKRKNINPKTGRSIKKDGPLYKAFKKDCGWESPKPKPASPPRPKPASPPKPKRVSPPKTTFMSFDQIKNMYLTRVTSYPIAKKDILLRFHPDKLPQEVKNAMKGHPSFDQFASRVFDELFKMGSVRSMASLTIVLNKHRAKFDSPIAPVKAAPPKPKLVFLSFEETKQYYLKKAISYPMNENVISSRFHYFTIDRDMPNIPPRFALEVYKSLYKMGTIPDRASLIHVLDKHKSVFDQI